MNVSMPQLDMDFVRAQFPAFQEAALRDLAFFENAGGSYACRFVLWRLNRFYRERKVQPYGPYGASMAAGAEMDEARTRLALALGVRSEEVSFGPSTSQNTYVLAQAFRQMLQPGDAIIVTNQDHEANSGVWRRLADEGIEIKEWKIDPDTGHLDLADLPNLLDGPVKLLCVPHCSNVVGEINDIKKIVRISHIAGVPVCVDGVSYAPHGLPNVGELKADIYLFSAYKTFGPHQGVMVIRSSLGTQLPNQGHHFNGGTLYKRFTPAGPDHAQVAACAGIADYFDTLYKHHVKAGRDAAARAGYVHDMLRAHETRLLAPLLDFLNGHKAVRLLGPATVEDRAPTLALDLARSAEPVASELSTFGIMAGGGDFYAQRPLDAMGVDPAKGVLRLSFLHYTSEEDIDRLISALDQVL